MFAYIFLVIATLLIIKPVRNSLFLTKFGIAYLPYAFVLVALCSAGVAYFYSKLSSKVRLNRLISTTLIISVISLILFWLLLFRGYSAPWFYFFMYIWVALFGVLTTSQFWLLANYVFDAREAKRLFGILGAGAISGGIFGGYFANFFAPVLGTENLILFGAGFLLVCMIILPFTWERGARERYREQVLRKKRTGSDDSSNPLQIIFRSRHIGYLAAIVGVGVLVANFVDYQYSAIATELIKDEDRLTAFFGFWLSNLSVVSLLIQLLMTGRIIKSFGVISSTYFLPAGIFIGALATLFFGGLWSAVLIKISDGGFKQSIHKAGIELLALPIPAVIKNRIKAFIDVFVDNFATGVSGVLLILFTQVTDISTRHLSIIILLLIAIWIYLNSRIKNEYIEAFRQAIEKRTIRLDEQTITASDPNVIKNLLSVIDNGNEKQILYILNLLENVQSEQVTPYLEKLLDHKSSEVVVKAIELTQSYPELDLRQKIEQLLYHADQGVRIAAVEYQCSRSENIVDFIHNYLHNDDIHIKMAALMYTARICKRDSEIREHIQLNQHFKNIIEEIEDENIQGELLEFVKIETAKILGEANDPELYPYLHLLMADLSIPVLREAILNAGKTQSEEFLPILIPHLNTKYVRKFAREALSMYGNEIIEPLVERLNDPVEDRMIKLGIPPILAKISTQKSVDALQKNINQDDIVIRYAIIRALNRIKSTYDGLKIDHRSVEEQVLDESRNYFTMLNVFRTQSSNENISEENKGVKNARQLLIQALEERLDRNLEIIFRLLGLRYTPEDILNAYQGVTSNKLDQRANAIEFLDNLLNNRLKKYILPILEGTTSGEIPTTSENPFGLKINSNYDCLKSLLEGDDNWLKVCALYLIAELDEPELTEVAAEHAKSRDPMIRETASLLADRIDK